MSDVPPLRLEPLAFNNLALWLNASDDSRVVGEDFRVASWSDLSGNGNHALQSDPARMPKFVAAMLNGLPALTFDGEPSTLLVADADSLRFGQGDFTYVLVGRWRNDGTSNQQHNGSGAMLAKVEFWFPYRGVAMFANYPGLFVGAPALPRFVVQLEQSAAIALSSSNFLNDDVFRVYAARRIGEWLEVRIDGRSEGGTQVASELNVSATGQPLRIGGTLGQQLRGDIAEIIALKGSTPDQALHGLELHLLEKYGL